MKYLEDPTRYIDPADRERLKNVFGFPDQSDNVPAGWRGWLLLHYRHNGLNIMERSEHVRARVGHLYGRLAYDGLEKLYAAVLKAEVADQAFRVANDNAPNLATDRGRLLAGLIEPEHREGWFADWRPPRFGPPTTSPLAHFASKQPRVHTGLAFEEMTDLFQGRRVGSTRFS